MKDRYGVQTNPGRIRTTSDLHLAWDVEYQPGTLRVVGTKDGQVVASEEVVTTGEPASIRLTADKDTLDADRRDVAHLTVEIVDDEGRVVPTASNSLRFSVTGAAQLIGVDNGSMSIDEAFKGDQRRAFNGLALGIVQSTRTSGPIDVTVSSDGLLSRSIKLESK
jgi:beta-galactosidase